MIDCWSSEEQTSCPSQKSVLSSKSFIGNTLWIAKVDSLDKYKCYNLFKPLYQVLASIITKGYVENFNFCIFHYTLLKPLNTLNLP